jgi:branched-chain amino acid transport system substrate-binding protein
VPVEAIYLDDGDWTPARVGKNARTATQDSTAIAYLGDFESGASRTSVPITNAAGMLQVSPASSATDLVDAFPGSDDVPDVQASGSRTFGRVIPGDEAQARAAAEWVDSMDDIRSVSTSSDNSAYGKDMVEGFRNALSRALVGDAGDLDFYAGVERPSDVGPVMVTDAQLTDEAIPQLADGTLATSAALDPTQLPPVADEFVGRFVAEYDREPGRYAAYGYEAMAVILDSIDRASDPADRAAVIDAFFATADRDSILGTYSIADNGETTFDHMTGYEVKNGQARPTEALFAD